MGHPLMFEPIQVTQAEIDWWDRRVKERDQRINELGEELEGFKFLVGELQELVMVEQGRVRELEAWREQVRGKLGELRDRLYCTEQPEWAVDQVEKVMAELGLAKEQL